MTGDEVKTRPVEGAEAERLRAAGDEFGAAARRSLARFEARWPQELELGLQELDARYEQIVAELKVFFAPQGVMPNLPLPASMAEVFRAHVDEVVRQMEARESRLVEELRGELEAELLRYLQSTKADPLAAADAVAGDAGASAAGAAAGSVRLQFHAWTLVAFSTPVHLDNVMDLVEKFVDDCFDLLCDMLPSSLSFLVKLIRKVRKWSKTPARVLKTLSPHHLLLWALKKLASPARLILLATLPLAVKQAMSRARASLKTRFDERAATIVRETQDFIEKTHRGAGAPAPADHG